MRLGGVMLLMVMVAGAVVGFYAIAANISMVAPVDSSGNTVNNATNLTMTNVSAVAKVAPTAGVFIALILAVIVLAIVVVYFASGSMKTGGRRGRY